MAAYHLHVNAADDGNCTTTKGHLDPTNRGDKPPCDASQPATCQVGDLSGKYGKITEDPFTVEYTDPFATLMEGSDAFFGDRSFVIHFDNGTRLTCANFEMDEDMESPATSQECEFTQPVKTTTAMPTTAMPTGGMTAMPTGSNPTEVPVTAGATSAAVSFLAIVGAVLLL